MVDFSVATTPSRLLIISDPGLPSRRVNAILEPLENDVRKIIGDGATFDTHTEFIRITLDGDLMSLWARGIDHESEGNQFSILITEVPRYMNGRPLMAEVFPDQNAAIISLPSLGLLVTKSRLRRMIVSCVQTLVTPDIKIHQLNTVFPGDRWHTNDDGNVGLCSSRWVGPARQVMGMVLANEPWKAARRLSGAMAGAIGTGAFGIFYSSIWQMASYISATRMTFIGMLSISIMVSWLILANNLWDRPKGEKQVKIVSFYNASTVASLLLTVLALFFALVVFIFISSVIVIDPEFMESILQQEAEITHYTDIAWFSASMGMIAGAIGSSFDSNTDIRKLTHGQRERQRAFTEDDDVDAESNNQGHPQPGTDQEPDQ